MSERVRDVLIIGAGIIGAACADALSAEGFSVTIIESHATGAGATSTGMGHLLIMDDSEAQFALSKYAVSLWKELAPQIPQAAGLDPCGTIWVASNAEEMNEVHRKHRLYTDRGVEAEILDPHQLRLAEPNFRPGLAGGLCVAGDMVIYPPIAAQWLLDRAMARGAQMLIGDVIEMSGHHARLRDGTRLSAAYTVNAAGIHSPRLLPGLEVRPRKGHLSLTAPYPGFISHEVVELGYLKSAHGSVADSVAFNLQPRNNGQILIGSSRQFSGEDTTIEEPILQRMHKRAAEYMPALAGLSIVRTWTGFRPTSSDKLPLIGPVPSDPDMILATGHEGLGITTSIATARLIVDHLLHRTSKIDPAPYLPSRFASLANPMK